MITKISVNDFRTITINITTEIPIDFLNICTPISKSDLTPLTVAHLAPVRTNRGVARNFRRGTGVLFELCLLIDKIMHVTINYFKYIIFYNCTL